MYKYKSKVISVYDGDTITLQVDLGFNITFILKARLYGIDTPELRSKDLKEKEKARKARDYLRELILDKEVYIHSHKKGKYGRYLVDIFIYDEDNLINVNSLMIVKGFAVAYYGGKR